MTRRPAALAIGLVIVAAMAAAGTSPSAADVPRLTSVGAYGYFANVSLFGGAANTSGPSPTVVLPGDGAKPAAAPLTTVVPSAKAQFGPATLLESGETRVSIDGTPGANGSLTASASVNGIDDPPLPLLYKRVASTCTATRTDVSGTTTLAGDLAVSVFTAPDPREGDPKDIVPLPANPGPNTERAGELSNIGDRYKVVLNEQARDGDLLTVNAVHMYLLGPVAVGDLIIAQTRCRVGATVPAPAGSTPLSAAPATTGATDAPAPALSSRPPTSSAVLPVTLGGVVLAAGVAGATLRRRRQGGGRPPW